MRVRALVVGSINVDFFIYLDRLPMVDETVSGGEFEVHMGGKGANQAVGLSKLGSEVCIVGCVGKDEWGILALNNLKSYGIAIDYVRHVAVHTGTAFILVDRKGEVMIAVAPGANRLVKPSDVRTALDAMGKVDVILIPLEVPLETVIEAAELGASVKAKVILTPAPARPLPDGLFKNLYAMTPNVVELFQILGVKPPGDVRLEDVKAAAVKLGERGISNLVVTLGAQGALVYSGSTGELKLAKAFAPDGIVDTTGAGDAFTSALAYAVAHGLDLYTAALVANASAAIKISRRGAQEGLPTMDDLKSFLRSRGLSVDL